MARQTNYCGELAEKNIGETIKLIEDGVDFYIALGDFLDEFYSNLTFSKLYGVM